MISRVINPWEIPPGENTSHRLIHMKNLPPECQWSEISNLFQNFTVELHHFFGKQALIQLNDSPSARSFIAQYHGEVNVRGYPVRLSLSPLIQLYPIHETTQHGVVPSRVICIQVIHLRVYLGIHDIYDECSKFGVVEKIICFEKSESKFALVQMSTVTEAGYVLSNLSNSSRHLPSFQMRIQYSKNQDIIIKFNNSKSFDFTQVNATSQFAALREASAGEAPFFEPEQCPEVPPAFDLWRPVHFDSAFSKIVSVSGFDESRQICDQLKNLASQYGPVLRVRKFRRSIFLSMKTGFYARLVVTFLQGCPFEGKVLNFELAPHGNIPGIFDQSGNKDEIDEGDDLELNDYSSMCFPSQAAAVRSDVPLKEFEQTGANIQQNLLIFPKIADAALFIANKNNTMIDRKLVRLSFALIPK